MWDVGLDEGRCPPILLPNPNFRMLPSSTCRCSSFPSSPPPAATLHLAYGGLKEIRTWIPGGGYVGCHGVKLPAVRSVAKGEGRACVVNNRPDTFSGVAIIMMGVSGSGKSTVGELLSKSIPCPFIDADDFHLAENKEKMRNGIPLTDEDRLPWLEVLRDELANYIRKGEWVVLACSALASRYREILSTADPSHQIDNKQESDARNLSDVNLEAEYSRRAGYIGKFLFVHLKGSVELFESRLAARHKEGKHFMPPSLLRSQLDLLDSREGDERVVCVDASLSPDDIVNSIRHELLLKV